MIAYVAVRELGTGRHEIRVLLPQREDSKIERELHIIPFWL